MMYPDALPEWGVAETQYPCPYNLIVIWKTVMSLLLLGGAGLLPDDVPKYGTLKIPHP
jgi:hypothetical protein